MMFRDTLAGAAAAAALAIRPLDSKGKPASNGRIGLLAIGQSTTRLVIDTFRSVARNIKAQNVVLVNGAIDGNDSQDWAMRGGPWNWAIIRIGRAGANAGRIQVLRVDAALIFPSQYGAFPARNSVYVDQPDQNFNLAKQRFPNFRLTYFTSGYYGGWVRKPTQPEPFAYERAFGVRDFVLSKIPQSPPGPGG